LGRIPFLGGGEFGFPDDHALSPKEKVAKKLIAAAAAEKGCDVSVDGIHNAEWDLQRQ
jgi:hypothetical protein